MLKDSRPAYDYKNIDRNSRKLLAFHLKRCWVTSVQIPRVVCTLRQRNKAAATRMQSRGDLSLKTTQMTKLNLLYFILSLLLLEFREEDPLVLFCCLWHREQCSAQLLEGILWRPYR